MHASNVLNDHGVHRLIPFEWNPSNPNPFNLSMTQSIPAFMPYTSAPTGANERSSTREPINNPLKIIWVLRTMESDELDWYTKVESNEFTVGM
jgi:hypothetical protein